MLVLPTPQLKMLLSNIITSLFILLLTACSHSSPAKQDPVAEPGEVIADPKEKFEKGKVIAKIPCVLNPSLSFALYLPSGYDTLKKYPVIIFLDPHAGGELPVKKYARLGEEFGVILLGSNDSKNGLPGEQAAQITNTLCHEAKNRLSIEDPLTLAGFSGGAKV